MAFSPDGTQNALLDEPPGETATLFLDASRLDAALAHASASERHQDEPD